MAANLRQKFFIACIFVSLSSCSVKNETDVKNLDKAIHSMNMAALACSKKTDLKKPDLHTLKKLSEFSVNTITSYLGYRSELNNQACFVKNGTIPLQYLVTFSLDSTKSSQARQKAKRLIKNIRSSRFVKNVDYLNTLPKEQRQKLEAIEYFKNDFDLLVVSKMLAEYRENNTTNLNQIEHKK